MADTFTIEDVENLGDAQFTPSAAQTSTPTTDTPPKRKRGRPKGSTNASKLLPVGEIEDGISSFLSLLGMGVSMVDAYDGSCIIKGAQPLANSIAQMAAKDKKIHEQLTKALRAGSYAAVATAAIPIVVSIGANHGVFPPFMMMDTGVEPTIYGRARTPDNEEVNMESDSGGVGSNGDNPLAKSGLDTLMGL
jgi:hypothetical protein